MADPRFFAVEGPFTLEQLAEIAGARVAGDAGSAGLFRGVAPLDAAGPEHVSFLDNRRYADQFSESRAGACLVHPDMAERAPQGMALLLSDEPYCGYARVAQAFYPAPKPEARIDAAARVDPSARVGEGCRIDAGAVVGARAEIGDRCRIGANVVIGDAVVLGNDCSVGPGASLTCCLVGNGVVIHAGARIGQDGFGFAPRAEGHLKVPQLGRVVIEDDVEIGANSTIDRGAGPDTVIGAGSKIDNLVQIGHNVRIGRGCIVVAQVGISGSTTIGDFVMMGGQAGLSGHLTIGDGARVGAQSGVMRDVDPGETVFGYPAMRAKQYWRQIAALGRLARGRGED